MKTPIKWTKEELKMIRKGIETGYSYAKLGKLVSVDGKTIKAHFEEEVEAYRLDVANKVFKEIFDQAMEGNEKMLTLLAKEPNFLGYDSKVIRDADATQSQTIFTLNLTKEDVSEPNEEDEV